MTDLANSSSAAPTLADLVLVKGTLFVGAMPLEDALKTVLETVSPYRYHPYGKGKAMELSYAAQRVEFEGTPTAEQVGDAICSQLQTTVQIYRGLIAWGMAPGSEVRISRSFTDKERNRVPHLSVTAKIGRYLELEAAAKAPAPAAPKASVETLESVAVAYFERHGVDAPLAPAAAPEAVQMAWYKAQMSQVEEAPEAPEAVEVVEVEEAAEAKGAIAEALIESGVVAPF